jgi:hypothetical protein
MSGLYIQETFDLINKNKLRTVLIFIIIFGGIYLLKKFQTQESYVNNTSNVEHFDGTGKVFSWHSNPHPGPCNASCSCYPGSYVRPGAAPGGGCKGC